MTPPNDDIPRELDNIFSIRYLARDGKVQEAQKSRAATQAAFAGLVCGQGNELGADESTDAAQRIHSEAQSLVKWAHEQGVLIDPGSWLEIVPKWQEMEGASEHHVFAVPKTGRVIKSTIPPNFGARGEALIYIQNQIDANKMFGDDILFEGVLDFNGVAIITSQPFVKGESPSVEDIAEWFEAQGYVNAGYNRWKHPDTGADIADTHPGNLIRTPEGNIIPIDLQILKPHLT